MAEETITTRDGSRSQERPTGTRALSTFSPVEQRAILALVEAADRSIPAGSQPTLPAAPSRPAPKPRR